MILNNMESPLIVIFLGKSGAGKDTQMELLREKMGFDFVGSGALLRDRKKINDFTGKKISQTIDNGGLVLTPVIFKLWMQKFEELKNRGNVKGIIMDGSPRKIKEAYLLDEALDWYEWNKNVKVMLIDISDQESIERIGKRRYCAVCKEIYIYDGKMDKCAKCGGEITKRLDDDVDGVKKRLEWFKEEVEPVIDYYKETNRLITINGEQEIEKVFEDILKAL
jgi:adenylate kinase